MAPDDAPALLTTERRHGRVLDVDDEPPIVDFLCEWLESEGHVGEGLTDPVAARA